MKNGEIPTSIELMGFRISVLIIPERDWRDDKTAGHWDTTECRMLIRGDRPAQFQQQVFCHELVHAILEKMGEEELCGNEKFVDVFGSLLHQVWASATYDRADTSAKKKAK